MRFVLPVEFEATPELVAKMFVAMDDDAQAKFFVECASLMADWGIAGILFQLHAIGRHLVDCECGTPGGRQLVREIASAMEHEERKAKP